MSDHYLALDYRINATHPERPEDIEEALAVEQASRLRLQTVISSVWTDLMRGRPLDAIYTLETEFPQR